MAGSSSSSSLHEQTGIDHFVLCKAIKEGDIGSLKTLMAKTVSKSDEVDVLLRQTHFDNNSIHIAVQLSESVKLVKEIFNQCGSSKSLAMLMQQNMNGDTPLHIAARMGSTEIVSLFIEDRGIDVEIGIVPAAENKENVEQLVRVANKKNNTALHEALRYQPKSGIPLVLRRADPGFVYLANDSGETLLYLAAKFGTPDFVEHILELSPHQNYGALGEGTVLHELALRNSNSFPGNFSKLVGLLRHRVKEVNKNGLTALHYAVHSGNIEFVVAVMEVDPFVCYMRDKDGMTALHHAASKGSINVLKHMLQHCMDCWEVLDNEGRNFLHVAADHNQSDVLEYVLTEIGSDLMVDTIISMKDKKGKAPCEMAQEFYTILRSNNKVKRSTWDGDEFMAFENALNTQTAARIEEASRELEEENARDAAVREVTRKVLRERMEYYNQTLVVVSALIATIAFAANFTLPGGYKSDGPHKGTALLAHKPSFIVFIVSNTLAMVFSALAILIQFVGKIVSVLLIDPDILITARLLGMTILCNLLAILAMMVAFLTGTYTVLSHLPGLAIPVCILGCIFFVLSFLVIYKIMEWLKKEEVELVLRLKMILTKFSRMIN